MMVIPCCRKLTAALALCLIFEPRVLDANDGASLSGAGVEALKTGRYEEGIGKITTAIQSGDLSKEELASAYASRAYGYLQRGAFDLALSDLNTSLVFVPDDGWALQRRCWVQAHLGRILAAILDCAAAIRSGADPVAVYNSIAEIHQKRGKYSAALSAYDAALELRTEPYVVHNRARLRTNQGDFLGAISDYSEAIDKVKAAKYYPNLDLANMLFERGNLYLKTGNYKDAIDDYTEILSKNPNNAIVLNNRCWSRAMIQSYESALEDCDQALKLVSDDPFIWDSRGFIYYNLGEFILAKSDFDMALDLESEMVHSLYYRALIHEMLGDFDSAKEDFSILHEKAPSWIKARDKFIEYGFLDLATGDAD